jgi:hypothetical protein
MKILFSILLMLICIGCKAQDSSKYYRHKFLYFKDKYTTSIGFSEVKRMSDSCKKYYYLLNHKR